MSKDESTLREETPTVTKGNYIIPKHKNWVTVDGKYVNFVGEKCEEIVLPYDGWEKHVGTKL